jgi:hypothetical protein
MTGSAERIRRQFGTYFPFFTVTVNLSQTGAAFVFLGETFTKK